MKKILLLPFIVLLIGCNDTSISNSTSNNSNITSSSEQISEIFSTEESDISEIGIISSSEENSLIEVSNDSSHENTSSISENITQDSDEGYGKLN